MIIVLTFTGVFTYDVYHNIDNFVHNVDYMPKMPVINYLVNKVLNNLTVVILY